MLTDAHARNTLLPSETRVVARWFSRDKKKKNTYTRARTRGVVSETSDGRPDGVATAKPKSRPQIRVTQ